MVLSKVVACMFLYLPSLLDFGLPQRCDHPVVYCACLLVRGWLKEILVQLIHTGHLHSGTAL